MRVTGGETGRRFSRDRLRQLASRRVLDPSVATVRTVGYITGYFYFFGGVAVLCSTFLSGWNREADLAVIRAIGIFAISVSPVLAMIGGRLPRWCYHLLVLLGTALITTIVWNSGSEFSAVAASSIYAYVLMDAVIFFAFPGMMAQGCACAVAATVSLHHMRVGVAGIVMVEVIALGATIIVTWLARTTSIAQQDQLTKLLNRRGFERHLQDTLDTVNRSGGQVALVFIDIDRFKSINDTEGHHAGDLVLAACAEAWQKYLGDRGSLGRFGGDEFIFLMHDFGLGQAADLADELRSLLPDGVTASAGVTVSQPGDTMSTLTGRADTALYEAKKAGRDQTVAYGDPNRSASELEAAILKGEMFLEFQPVCDRGSLTTRGFEALVRWDHPTKGLIPPAKFVPQAERTGAIHALGMWTLNEACRIAAASSADHEPVRVSINVSIPELRDPGYVQLVQASLHRHGVAPGQLTIEVTEAVFDDEEEQVTASLSALRALGVRIAIDDFGSGYSSLRWLEHFPVDVLKVDRAFVSCITDPAQNAPVLEGIIRIGRTLGMDVVIEGVETEAQVEVLLRVGADLMQGYLFGRPRRPADGRLPAPAQSWAGVSS